MYKNGNISKNGQKICFLGYPVKKMKSWKEHNYPISKIFLPVKTISTIYATDPNINNLKDF